MENLSNGVIFPLGDQARGSNFTGDVWLKRLVANDTPWNCPLGNVTFAPRARNNWHRHPGGQILLVTGGTGWYQEEGCKARLLHAGDVVTIPSNTKHWHGAAANSWFTHLYIVANPEMGACQWLEPVSDEQYDRLEVTEQ